MLANSTPQMLPGHPGCSEFANRCEPTLCDTCRRYVFLMEERVMPGQIVAPKRLGLGDVPLRRAIGPRQPKGGAARERGRPRAPRPAFLGRQSPSPPSA